MTFNFLEKATHKFNLPSWLSGFKYMKCYTPKEFTSKFPKLGKFEVIDNQLSTTNPLPCNISDRIDLNKDKDQFPHSFYEVPELVIPQTYKAEFYDCYLCRYTNEWNNDFYALISSNNKSIISPGLGYTPQHKENFSTKNPPSFKSGTFLLGMWYNNYYLWMTNYMSKFLLAKEVGLSNFVIPSGRLKSFNNECLASLDLNYLNLPKDENCWHFETLSLVSSAPYNGILKNMPFNLCENDKKQRKIYVSRQKAKYRHLENEIEVQSLFKAHGWEIHCMEDYSFSEQQNLMSQTVAFASLHGAAFGNITLCPKGAHIFELSVKQRPNANFYALASSLEHHYWVNFIETVGKNKDVIYDNAVADLNKIEDTIKKIKTQLSSK